MTMIYSKHIPKILSLALVVFLSGISIAHAYEPLAPLPISSGIGTSTGYENMGTYLSGMMKFLIAIGGVIAIVTAIIGGVQYIASGITPSQKNDAKKRIENAFVGLAIVLTSYLILNSINPDLVKINLNLPKVRGTFRETSTVDQAQDSYGITKYSSLSCLMLNGLVGGEGGDFARCTDSKVRKELFDKHGIGVNKQDCDSDGDTNCTSLNGLPQRAIDGLIKLSSDCKKYHKIGPCAITITGGTESGHKTHGPGKPIVDLSKTPALNEYIISDSNVLQKIETKAGIQYYLRGGGSYLDENIEGHPPHWHVTF
mgnify:CR=1 FL=1